MDWAVACLNCIKTLCQMESTPQTDTVINCEQIHSHMKNYDDYNDVFRRFMPSSSIYDLTTEKKVFSTLQSRFKGEELKKLAEFVIKNDARRIFLCLTFFSDGLQYLPKFMKTKFTDKDLPVANSSKGMIGGLISGDQPLDGTPSEIDHHSTNFALEEKKRVWHRSQFLEKQWFFLSPDCSEASLEIHDFDPKLPIAYLPPSSNGGAITTPIRESNFSIVWRVHLHPDHFGHHQSSSTAKSSSNGIEAALKILTVQGASSDASGTMEEFYRRETRTLQEMANLNYGHLINTIYIYKSGQDRCFLFPWAHGGNLNEFWKSFDKLEHNIDFVAWSLDQMHGIFEGLSKLHQQKIRHGDIKPHNILHFPQDSPGSASGRLVIADVGLSKFHQDYTEDRKYTSTTQCTVMYQPPEMKKSRRSRLFDYWSLGCVFLEFTIWIYDGHDGLRNFRKRLMDSQPNLLDDKTHRFWNYDDNHTPKLNTAVKNTMDEMQNRDSPSNEFAHELIELIRSKLLNIDAY